MSRWAPLCRLALCFLLLTCLCVRHSVVFFTRSWGVWSPCMSHIRDLAAGMVCLGGVLLGAFVCLHAAACISSATDKNSGKKVRFVSCRCMCTRHTLHLVVHVYGLILNRGRRFVAALPTGGHQEGHKCVPGFDRCQTHFARNEAAAALQSRKRTCMDLCMRDM